MRVHLHSEKGARLFTCDCSPAPMLTFLLKLILSDFAMNEACPPNPRCEPRGVGLVISMSCRGTNLTPMVT